MGKNHSVAVNPHFPQEANKSKHP